MFDKMSVLLKASPINVDIYQFKCLYYQMANTVLEGEATGSLSLSVMAVHRPAGVCVCVCVCVCVFWSPSNRGISVDIFFYTS